MKQYLIIGSTILTLLATIGGLTLHIRAINAERKTLQHDFDTAKAVIATQVETITALQVSSQQNQAAQRKLREQVTSTSELLNQRDQQVKKLEKENETYRTWSNSDLPADVVRLHGHPAITGAEGYQDWLRRRDTLPATIEQPENQR